MSNWIQKDIPDLTGKIILVTGANSGLGKESALAFAKKNAQVVMACRKLDTGKATREEIAAQAPNAKLHLMELDLSSLTMVGDFASQFKSRFPKLDVLMNNAGVMATPEKETEDGFEFQLGINHLGHFALTGLLLPTLKSTPGSRVVNVSSLAARQGRMHFENLMLKKEYDPQKSYRQSKLAVLLFSLQLQRKFEEQNIDSISVAAHPGIAATNLARYMAAGGFKKVLAEKIFLPILPTAEKGAWSQEYAATMPDVKGGGYYGPGGWRQWSGHPQQVDIYEHAKDRSTWEELWQRSEELTHLTYDFAKQPA